MNTVELAESENLCETYSDSQAKLTKLMTAVYEQEAGQIRTRHMMQVKILTSLYQWT